MKLSIIVPIYNIESYLRECLESISLLDGDDWEVIMVNDGSTDSSPTIAASFADGKRFKLISQDNMGLSSARNTGMDEACGDYISFIDGDDIIDPSAMRRTIDACRGGVDIVVGDYLILNGDGTRSRDDVHRFSGTFPSGCDGETFIGDWYITASSVVWRSIFRREFLFTAERRFIIGINFEDVEWSINTYAAAGIIDYCPADFYIYRKRDGSIMHSRTNFKKVRDAFFICRKLMKDARNHRSGKVRRVYHANALHCATKVLSQYITNR